MNYQQTYVPFQPTLTSEGLSYFGLMMEMQAPISQLSDSILAFLQVTVDKQTPYPVIPDGTNVLFFSKASGLVGGIQSSILEVRLIEPGEYFGVWFKPAMLRQFFNVDLADISQQIVQEDFLSHLSFLYLSERLYEKQNFLERVCLCESLFLNALKVRPLPKLHHALQLIYRTFGNISVASIAKEVGLSDRHLNRMFALHTGLSTKAFSQVIRAQALLRANHHRQYSLFQCGLDLGFYDQSHVSKSLAKHSVDQLSSVAKVFMSDFYKPQGS